MNEEKNDIDIEHEMIEEEIQETTETIEKENEVVNEVVDSDNKVDEYLNFTEDDSLKLTEKLELFQSIPLVYESQEYTIDIKQVHQCKENLVKHGYILITNQDDIKSKYLVKLLHQSIDKYDNKLRMELKFNLSHSEIQKIDFNDFEEYLLSIDDSQLIVIDLCKLGYVDKEYFLNSFLGFMKKSESKVKFRELLHQKEILLCFIAYDSDLTSKEDAINRFKILDHISEQKDEKKSSVDEVIFTLIQDPMKAKILFLATLFKGVSPKELQELLGLILDKDEIEIWRKNRKNLLKELQLTTSILSKGNTIRFNIPFKGNEESILHILINDDPFFVSELFSMFEQEYTLLHNTLLGIKSKSFVEGFFALLRLVTLDNPSELSLEWFEDKFSQEISGENPNYFFSLGASAILVAEVLNDYSFVNSVLKRFQVKKQWKELFYLVEYFSYLDSFDSLYWYKVILSDIDMRSRLKSMIYRSIYKKVQDDICYISELLSWNQSSHQKLVQNSFYVLVRLSSDMLKENNWNFYKSVHMPSLLQKSNDSKKSICQERYIEFIYTTANQENDIHEDVYLYTLHENINKLFFTKLLGLMSSENYKHRVKAIKRDINELFNSTQKPYIVLIVFF